MSRKKKAEFKCANENFRNMTAGQFKWKATTVENIANKNLYAVKVFFHCSGQIVLILMMIDFDSIAYCLQ